MAESMSTFKVLPEHYSRPHKRLWSLDGKVVARNGFEPVLTGQLTEFHRIGEQRPFKTRQTRSVYHVYEVREISH